MSSTTTRKNFNLFAWMALIAVLIGFTPSVTEAVTCFVSTSNVPQAWLSSTAQNNSSNCGAGPADSNNNLGQGSPGLTLLNTSNIGGSNTWTLINSIVLPGTSVTGFSLTGTSGPAASPTAGNFHISTNLLPFAQYVIVLKDGKSLGPPPTPQTSWAWFLLDGTSSIACPAGFNLCGQWSMWGSSGNLRELGHMSLYGTGTRAQVSAPATLFLLGFGLIALRVATRKKGSLL